ncbi:MAG: hypothetical protein IPL32_20025 [Chloracidobacterium sp.]|nr:hypothetical protein [Chloracidobacterium sp.]
MTWSQFIGILAMVAQGINFALVFFSTFFAGHPEISAIIAGVLAFIQAVTGRIQGSANPLGK